MHVRSNFALESILPLLLSSIDTMLTVVVITDAIVVVMSLASDVSFSIIVSNVADELVLVDVDSRSVIVEHGLKSTIG